MTITVLRASQYRRMPWKNGKGETVEIAIHPDGADLGSFGWRLSMAMIATDGPFSAFPGIDRTLALIGGQGVELDITGLGQQRLQPSSPPLSFPGEAAVSARLRDGPVTDLNAMSRRNGFRHRLFPRGTTLPVPSSALWRIVVALAPISLRLNREQMRLETHDALICEAEDGALRLDLGDARGFYLIHIDRI